VKTLFRIFGRLLGTSKERSPEWKDLQRVIPRPTRINGEWSLTPEELSTIFAIKGWSYASEVAGYGAPTPEGLAYVINGLVNTLAEAENDHGYATLGRFLALKDADLPNSYDVYLHVGFVWDEKALMGVRGS
jgi:hypothetical protein